MHLCRFEIEKANVTWDCYVCAFAVGDTAEAYLVSCLGGLPWSSLSEDWEQLVDAQTLEHICCEARKFYDVTSGYEKVYATSEARMPYEDLVACFARCCGLSLLFSQGLERPKIEAFWFLIPGFLSKIFMLYFGLKWYIVLLCGFGSNVHVL